jgi:hypothetical protein
MMLCHILLTFSSRGEIQVLASVCTETNSSTIQMQMSQLLFIIVTLLFSALGPAAASMVQLSEFLATDPEVPGSIPGATRFSE